MQINQIKNLIKKGESQNIEFKKSTAQLQAAIETICAFLNGNGGVVLIGVSNDGKIIGQDISDHTRQEIAKEINRIEPAAQVEVSDILISEKKYLIMMQVNSGHHAPYIYDGRAYRRNQATTSKMPQHRYEQLLVARGQLNYSWEEVLASEYSIKDLDQEEIYKTIADGIRENRIPASTQREDIKGILKRLELMKEGFLKRAAVMLFAKQRALGFSQCMIKMARFEGTDKLGNFIDNQQIRGNAFDLLEEADAFLRRHLAIAGFFKPDQFKRIDKPTLPVMAVREALINALCHRDYSDKSTDIALAIFDDRLEIWNSGELLNKLTVKSLRHSHHSVLRNKLIANVFYVRGFIEKWGIGTNKMISLCKQEELPEPEFRENQGGLTVVFRFKKLIGQDRKKNKLERTLRQDEILKLLQSSKLNGAQLTNKLKSAPSVRMVQKDLLQLERAGLVRREGKARAMVWVII